MSLPPEGPPALSLLSKTELRPDRGVWGAVGRMWGKGAGERFGPFGGETRPGSWVAWVVGRGRAPGRWRLKALGMGPQSHISEGSRVANGGSG